MQKFPATSMVFGVISSKSDFIPEGLKLNTDGYIDILNKVVKAWINHVATGRPYKNKLSALPYHSSQKTQAWLSENFVDHN